MSALWPLQMFDPKADVNIIERHLPHWSQAGAVCFITWRTKDSIPEPVLRRWHADRDQWLRDRGIEPNDADWRATLRNHSDATLHAEFVKTFSSRWHAHLDDCHGACVLRNPEVSAVVTGSLGRFDGDRYLLTDFVVMPNHVHILASFGDEEGMLEQCESWKRFTATRINRLIGAKDRFWQQDGFDHLVRSNEQFEALRKYIANNPVRARLKVGEFVHFQKDLAGIAKAEPK